MTWQTPALFVFLGLVGLLLLALLRSFGLLTSLRLPEPFMEILDKMTDRPLLQKLLAERAQQGQARFLDEAALVRQITRRIIGQDAVVREIVSVIARRAAKIRRRKPMGVFLISGSPGTAKSELGKVLGDVLPGGGGAYLVAMNTLKDHSALARLFGANPGYVGHGHKTGLVEHLLAYPQTVVILDEFEKACQDAQEAFLQAFHDGYFEVPGRSGKVSTTGAVFILTANARAAEISALTARQQGLVDAGSEDALSPEELSATLRSILADEFTGPLFSRIDGVFAFAPLTPEALAAVALKFIIDEVEDYKMKLRPVPPQILLPYVDRYTKQGFDARDLYRDIERDFGGAASKMFKQGAHEIEIIYNARTETMTLSAVTDKPARAKAAGSRTASVS